MVLLVSPCVMALDAFLQVQMRPVARTAVPLFILWGGCWGMVPVAWSAWATRRAVPQPSEKMPTPRNRGVG
jgi:hypothetical protein